MTLYSEVVKDIESAKSFCSTNSIKPFMIVVVWDEKEKGK